jgi:hypothetical protein
MYPHECADSGFTSLLSQRAEWTQNSLPSSCRRCGFSDVLVVSGRGAEGVARIGLQPVRSTGAAASIGGVDHAPGRDLRIRYS